MKDTNLKQKSDRTLQQECQLKQNLCSGLIVREERRKQHKTRLQKILKRKSPQKNWVEDGRTAGIRSLLMRSFLMLYSSCNDVSLYDSKKSMCLFGFFISKPKRESLKNVTLPVRLQQLCGLHEKITKLRVNFSLCPAVPNSFPPAFYQY